MKYKCENCINFTEINKKQGRCKVIDNIELSKKYNLVVSKAYVCEKYERKIK
jgi:hypothetical protein